MHRTVKRGSGRFETLCREPRGGAASTAVLGAHFGLLVDRGPPGRSPRSWDAGPGSSHEAFLTSAGLWGLSPPG